MSRNLMSRWNWFLISSPRLGFFYLVCSGVPFLSQREIKMETESKRQHQQQQQHQPPVVSISTLLIKPVTFDLKKKRSSTFSITRPACCETPVGIDWSARRWYENENVGPCFLLKKWEKNEARNGPSRRKLPRQIAAGGSRSINWYVDSALSCILIKGHRLMSHFMSYSRALGSQKMNFGRNSKIKQ